jgi:hypothetical protein
MYNVEIAYVDASGMRSSSVNLGYGPLILTKLSFLKLQKKIMKFSVSIL